MSLFEQLTELVTAQTSRLAPITLTVPNPTTPIFQLSKLIDHLTTTPIHPVYLPYLRFGALHAVRVTTVWAGLTKSRKGRVGVLQDLFGYLVMAWGGSTVVSLLLGQPPTWLVSPTPWLIYPTIYLLLIPTGLSRFFVSTCPAIIFTLLGAYADGVNRSTTISALPSLVGGSQIANANLWTYSLLSALAVVSGGLMVGLFGLAEDIWKIGVPGLFKGGVLGTLDAWGSVLVGIAYLALTRHSEEVSPLSNAFETILPQDVKHDSAKGVVSPAHARAIGALLFGTLLATRGLLLLWKGRKTNVPEMTNKTELVVFEEKESEVVKTPVQVRPDGKKATPRKSPRPSKPRTK
ncbi:hypothetical protein CI109_105938 [Kwoniella shandongensis]|uniref:Uncharacterized protein n=1 Tax=Kwoniella shandongensis TaxID=1734106 RepID=A0A5M6BSK1_9TREE|nr:uncharacterized protein CI109_006632 [Kwoniella shandongensis]KAA5524992.1 hypothetical protein CI109_006632 [Kwoniella shandongensis]